MQQEYETQKSRFESQPVILQRFLETQAQLIADTLVTKTQHLRFSLPDRVVAPLTQDGMSGTITIPEQDRQVTVGGFLQSHVREKLLQRLNELEQSANQAISVSAGLLRYAAAVHMIYNMLPSGRTVTYRADNDEQIATIPVEDYAPESAITQESTSSIQTRGPPTSRSSARF